MNIKYQDFHLESEAVDKILEIRDACLDGTGASLDEIRMCHNGMLPSDNKFKCFVTCTLYEHDLIDDEGKIRPELMQIEHIRELIGHCGNIEGSDEYCDNGYQVAKCLVEKLNLYDELCSIVTA